MADEQVVESLRHELTDWSAELRVRQLFAPAAIMADAADLIERLQREREELKHDVERHIEIAAAAEREREEIRAATIEECARVCKEQREDVEDAVAAADVHSLYDAYLDGCNDCAAAIRALAQDKERHG